MFTVPVVIAVGMFIAAASVHATGLTIQPIKVSHTIASGDSLTGSISLTNASEEAVKIQLKVEDFVPDAGAEGIKFVGRAPGITTVRDWIKLGSDDTFTLKQGEEKTIPYTVTTPKNAEPGSHFGVIFFKASKLQDTSQLKVGTQVGVLVFITVPGNFSQKGELLGMTAPRFVQGGPVDFEVNFRNTGTVHFEPKGLITIRNIFGKTVGSVPIEGQAVLPTGVKDLKARWDISGLLFGRYTATAEIKDGEGNLLTSSVVSFFALPVMYSFAFLAILFVVFWILRFLKRRVKISFH